MAQKGAADRQSFLIEDYLRIVQKVILRTLGPAAQEEHYGRNFPRNISEVIRGGYAESGVRLELHPLEGVCKLLRQLSKVLLIFRVLRLLLGL